MNRKGIFKRPWIIISFAIVIMVFVIFEYGARHSVDIQLLQGKTSSYTEDFTATPGSTYDYNVRRDILSERPPFGESKNYTNVYRHYKQGEVDPTVSQIIESSITDYRQEPILIGVLTIFLVVLYMFKVSGNKAKETYTTPEYVYDNTMGDMSHDELTIGINDVKGHDEILGDIAAVVDFIKNPGKYREMGARLPKGFLMYGPPGTGKTLLAKAIAKEAGVTFIHTTGSDFIEKYVGVGASRIRELFNDARKNAPSIVFIDEIDAIGRSRGKDDNSERDNTLNALLTEMDGFDSCDEVFVIASTNRLDMLDNALTRAGRFDKHLAINLPDTHGRLSILELYSKDKKISTDIDIELLAKTTNGFSGADLENLMNEASICAVKNNHKQIMPEDIEESLYSIQVKGKQKTNYIRSKEDTQLTAYHEIGHTLASIMLCKEEVTKVTIIPSTSGAGGITFTNPKEMSLMSKTELENHIKMLYAGRAAEYLLTQNEDSVTTGAHNDIERATIAMSKMVSELGMFKEFGIVNTSIFRNYDNKVEDKVRELSITYYNEAIEFLSNNLDRLHYIANKLIKYETLYKDQILELLGDIECKTEKVMTLA